MDNNYGDRRNPNSFCVLQSIEAFKLYCTCSIGEGATDQSAAVCRRQRHSSEKNLRCGEFRGMREWENNPIASLGCVLTPTWQLFTAESLWCNIPLGVTRREVTNTSLLNYQASYDKHLALPLNWSCSSYVAIFINHFKYNVIKDFREFKLNHCLWCQVVVVEVQSQERSQLTTPLWPASPVCFRLREQWTAKAGLKLTRRRLTKLSLGSWLLEAANDNNAVIKSAASRQKLSGDTSGCN